MAVSSGAKLVAHDCLSLLSCITTILPKTNVASCVLAVAGDQQAAAIAFQIAEEKTAGSGPKMDLVFSLLRCDTQFVSLPCLAAEKHLQSSASRLCTTPLLQRRTYINSRLNNVQCLALDSNLAFWIERLQASWLHSVDMSLYSFLTTNIHGGTVCIV